MAPYWLRAAFIISQELALYGEFTICETLHYFGRIYAMKKGEIDKQMEFLTELLNLPKCGSLIRKLRYFKSNILSLHEGELKKVEWAKY